MIYCTCMSQYISSCCTVEIESSLKDICGIRNLAEMLAMVNTVVVLLHRPTNMRRTWILKYGTMEALKPGATRFCSQYITLKRYLEIEDKLWQFMVSDAWRSLGLDGKRGVQEMKEWISNCDDKQKALELLKLLELIYEVLRYVDTRAYTAGDLYIDLYNHKSQL